MEEKILLQFTKKEKMRFSELEKALKVRSNKLTYHLNKLLRDDLIRKEEEYYSLKEGKEEIIPYLSEKRSPLVVVLIHIGNEKEAFLIKREKRPFKGYLALPGGRLVVGESIQEAAKRIMKDKWNVRIKYKQIKAIAHEHVTKKQYSFILIVIQAETKQKLEYTLVNKNRKSIVKSDYQLLTQKAIKPTIKTIYSKD